MRKPFQGVTNIILFNWHYYLIALFTIVFLVVAAWWLLEAFQYVALGIAFLILASTFMSLAVSTYIYDLSGLYNFEWLKIIENENILNIHAGFDETSQILKNKFSLSNLLVFDFYDPNKHTEISIKRARRATPPFNGTQTITTSHIPLQENSIDKVCVIFSAHEIRNDDERVGFFREINRVLTKEGVVYVTEHLRDMPNFSAYNIGFFHFLSRNSWERTFDESQFKIAGVLKITPFVTTFILSNNGNTY